MRMRGRGGWEDVHRIRYSIIQKLQLTGELQKYRMAWFTLTDNYCVISKEEKYSREPLQTYSCLLLTPLQSWSLNMIGK